MPIATRDIIGFPSVTSISEPQGSEVRHAGFASPPTSEKVGKGETTVVTNDSKSRRRSLISFSAALEMYSISWDMRARLDLGSYSFER